MAVTGAGKIRYAFLKDPEEGEEDRAAALREKEKACGMAQIVLICLKPFQLSNILHHRNRLADKMVIPVIA